MPLVAHIVVSSKQAYDSISGGDLRVGVRVKVRVSTIHHHCWTPSGRDRDCFATNVLGLN
jgi:hypothetical protein